MTANFLNRGLLSLLFLDALVTTMKDSGALGTRNLPRGAMIFSVWAVGALLLAIIPTDVPATPVSWHGAIHLVVAILAFLGGAFGALMLSQNFGQSRQLQDLKGVALPLSYVCVALVLLDLGLPFVAPGLNTHIGGLTERLFLGSVLLWIGVVSVSLAKARPSD